MTRRAPLRIGAVAAATGGIRSAAEGPSLTSASREGVSRERASSVKQAFHLQRLARRYRDLWVFYVEHNLFEEARKARVVVIEHLRGAREQWRTALRAAG